MTLDEAIKRFNQEAEVCEENADNFTRNKQPVFAEKYSEESADHRQLAEWLKELKEAKRLLKAAVEDLNSIHRVLEDNDILCEKYIACKGCPFNGENCNKWRYANEALALIGEDGEQNEVL